MAKGWHKEPRRHSLAARGYKTTTKKDEYIARTFDLDLKKYMGTWHDVGHYPQPFQENCKTSKANYQLISKDDISIKNTCKTTTGTKTITGEAFTKGKNTLSVSFFPFVRSPYKVEWVSKDYKHAIVGHPEKKNLWYLSRTKKISSQQLGAMNRIAKKKGYNPNKIVKKQVE
jgi:apolipoprotein D and lipocalin family protein